MSNIYLNTLLENIQIEAELGLNLYTSKLCQNNQMDLSDPGCVIIVGDFNYFMDFGAKIGIFQNFAWKLGSGLTRGYTLIQFSILSL